VSQEQTGKQPSNLRTLTFMVVLSFACALILSVLASLLAKPQQLALELDRGKQLMIAAKIFDFGGYFLMKKDSEYIPAKYTAGGVLVPGSDRDIPTTSQIIEVKDTRLVPFLVNKKGESTTFEKAGINLDEYINEFKKSGYYKQPWMLIYKIMPNPGHGEKPVGYVIPVNGFGLWDAIYGYIAVGTNGNTVIGISWYDQKETPGLGAEIAEPKWQSLFPGKHIFQEGPDGKTDFKTALLGITVVKGKVADVLGNSPKAKSAVDGMAGATLTGNGVTAAYQESLSPYRAFLIKVHEENKA
jgi:Na+-transporting NADH:ubiquinone oxidoreductase subunit C